MIRNLATWEKRMRVIALLPATCLALLATSGLAQQAASPPSPSSGQATGPGEKALLPAAQPAPQPGTEPPRAGADAPWGIERQVPRGELSAGMMSFAPTLHLRYRGFVLDLPCSADVDTATCAKIALGIIDHLRQGDWGGNNNAIRRDRDRGRPDRGDRGRSRGDRDDYDDGDESEGDR
jgi:hypothetical protein